MSARTKKAKPPVAEELRDAVEEALRSYLGEHEPTWVLGRARNGATTVTLPIGLPPRPAPLEPTSSDEPTKLVVRVGCRDPDSIFDRRRKHPYITTSLEGGPELSCPRWEPPGPGALRAFAKELCILARHKAAMVVHAVAEDRHLELEARMRLRYRDYAPDVTVRAVKDLAFEVVIACTTAEEVQAVMKHLSCIPGYHAGTRLRTS